MTFFQIACRTTYSSSECKYLTSLVKQGWRFDTIRQYYLASDETINEIVKHAEPCITKKDTTKAIELFGVFHQNVQGKLEDKPVGAVGALIYPLSPPCVSNKDCKWFRLILYYDSKGKILKAAYSRIEFQAD